MKVAIIGAGLSGLSCAHELERHGISPVIYERNSYIGEQYPHVTAVLNISHRPIKDSIKYYKDELNLQIEPLNTVDRVLHIAPHKTVLVESKLGYFFKNVEGQDSLKYQVYSKLKKSKIVFNQIGDYEALSKEFDYVVIATGNSSYTEELGCWQAWLDTYAKGALLLGDFDPNMLIMWLNKDYCKNGYAYLTPFSERKAAVVLVVSDVNEREIDKYWELFLYKANIKYTIIEEFKLEHRAGYVYPKTVGNIMFVGNSAGGIDSYLGFGHFNALTMGVSAARAIALGKDYDKLIESITTRNKQMREFRKLFNTLNNKQLDNIVASLRIPGIKQLLYDTNFNAPKYGAYIGSIVTKRPQR